MCDGRRARSRLLIAMALACGTRAAAQDSAPAESAAQSAEQAEEQPTAPVIVDGVTLFRVRGVSAYPAERRAAEIGNRIAALAADRSIPVESLTIRDDTLASLLAARGQRIMGVLDADARLEGVRRLVLASAYRTRIGEAIEHYRHDREPRVLWANVLRALAATLALVVGLWLGRTILRWLRRTLDRHYRPNIGDLRVQGVSIVRGEQLWQALHRAIGFAAVLLALLGCYTYLSYVLQLFPWTRGAGSSLSAMVVGPLATIGAGALKYLPNFIFLAILALLTRYALKFVHLFFHGVSDGTFLLPGFDADWAQPVDRIVRLLVIAFALVVAYPYIPGSGSEAFKGVTILLGLLFSIGSPSVISNLVAGQSLAFRRAFKVGDRIKIAEHVGEVVEIRLLTTYLRSPKNERIVIPNSTVLTSEVVNYSTLATEPGIILHTTVGIGYETPWRQVEAMLLEAAARTPGLLRQPAPYVLQKTLGDFAVVYEINAYAHDPHAMPRLYSALHGNILDLFNEYGVQIMTPAYEGDPERPKVVPHDEWFAAPARPAQEPAVEPASDGTGARSEPESPRV